METKEIKLLIDNPITLNYAITGAIIRFVKQPEILLLDYQEKPGFEVQKRLPAGRFQINDLNDAIEWFLIVRGRNFALEFVYGEVYNLSQRYSPLLMTAKNHAEHNNLFNDFTAKLLYLLQTCKLTEEDFKTLLGRTQMNTLIHELREETDADVFNLSSTNVYLSSSKVGIGGHYKIGYVSTVVDAPDIYEGSPDPKVLKSYWDTIDVNTLNGLFEGHKSKFQEGVAQIMRLNLHPNSSLLKKFASAAE